MLAHSAHDLLTLPPHILALSTADVRRKAPPPVVSYAHPLPPLDALMAELPPGVEAALKAAQLPDADLVRAAGRGIDCTALPFLLLLLMLLAHVPSLR